MAGTVTLIFVVLAAVIFWNWQPIKAWFTDEGAKIASVLKAYG